MTDSDKVREVSTYPESVVKIRHCPNCRSILDTFQLTAHSMAVEQYFIPRLRAINKSLGWSVRSFGETPMSELQMLLFTGICKHCSLLSTWDFSVEELEEVMTSKTPHAQIKWAHSPALLRTAMGKADEDQKPIFKNLLDWLDPEPRDTEK